jgi:hypothetical protein
LPVGKIALIPVAQQLATFFSGSMAAAHNCMILYKNILQLGASTKMWHQHAQNLDQMLIILMTGDNAATVQIA